MAKSRVSKKHPLITSLRRIAPNLAVSVRFDLDPNFRWDGDGPDPCDEGFDAYDVDVTVQAISKGAVLDGHGGIGGHYDKPNSLDADIGGYLPQILEEALDDLASNAGITPALRAEVAKAKQHVERHSNKRYNLQRRGWKV